MDKQNSFACKTCKASKHACKHVTSLDAWLQTPAGQSTEVLEGYSARSSSCTAHVDKLADDVFEGCGSYLQILEYLFNSAMKGRVYCSGNGLWPACQQCSFSDNLSAYQLSRLTPFLCHLPYVRCASPHGMYGTQLSTVG